MDAGDDSGGYSGAHGGDESGLDQSGVLLIRAWVQEGYVVGRILSTTVGGGSPQQTHVAIGVDAIRDSVANWLNDLTTTLP